METSRYARGAQGVDQALSKSRSESQPQEAMTTPVLPQQEGGHQKRVNKTTRGWFYQRSLPLRVAS
jgi:hypothetical protein